MQRAQGFAQQGGGIAFTAGIASATLLQTSYPFATITVYNSGTTQLAFIYSDNQLFPTPMSNPFTADENAHWFFYAANGRYDVTIASPELDVPWTIGDILLNDGGGGGGGGTGMNQTPWLSNIDGGGFNLTNVGFIDVTGGYLINGVPISNPSLWVAVPSSSSIYHQGFVGVINTNPQFALDVQGGINCTDKFYVNGVALGSGSGQDNDPWVVLGPTTINYPGSVGIQNANPQYALDVVGSINVSAGNNFFINGVAVGAGAATQPWIVLAGNRITYAGQVGIGVNPPGFPLDVFGDLNISGQYRVNGVPLSVGGGAGLWISGPNGAIFYNGGNVGIGTQTPPAALSVTGIVAAGAYALIGTPTTPLINQSGQFVGAGVNTGAFGIQGGYIQAGTASAPANVVATQYVEANNGFVITNFVGQTVINAAGAFVGAGVDVTGSGGYGINGAYIQSTVVPGVNGSGNVTAENVIEANAGFAVSGNWNQWVININGAFVGAGVDVTGNGGYGVRASYMEAEGNIVANAVSGVANSGYVEAASGFVVPAFGTIINASGQWVGPPIGGGSGIFNGPVAGTSFALVSNQGNPVINTAGAFVGAGVNVGNFGIEGGNIQAGTAQAPGNVVATQYVEANNGFVVTNFSGQIVINSAGTFVGAGVSVNGAISTNTGFYIGGNQVINNSDQFVGYGGVNTPGSVTGDLLTSTGNVQCANAYYNSGANGNVLVISNGIFSGNGVQTTSDVFSGLFGIEAGGAAGSPGNFLGITINGGNQFTLTTSLGNVTVRIIGGIVCAG